MSREDFEGIKIHASRVHHARVATNPARLAYAIKQLEKADIEYRVCNESNGHIQCWDVNDTLYNFWAGTGKIQRCNSARGIHTLIRIINSKKTAYEK